MNTRTSQALALIFAVIASITPVRLSVITDTPSKLPETISTLPSLIPTMTTTPPAQPYKEENAPCLDGHTYSMWATTEPASCETEGLEVRVCVICQKEDWRETPAMTHSYTLTKHKEATLHASGYKLFRCRSCSETYTENLARLSALEADMCGNSLLEQIMPNAPNPSFTKQAISRWREAHSREAAMNAGPIPLPCEDGRAGLKEWEVVYRYLTIPYAYTIIHNEDGTQTFNCWADPNMAAKQQEVYAQVANILRVLGIDHTITKQEAIRRINKWLCDFKHYDTTVRDDSSEPYYSLMVAGGKCHNYALAFQLLCLGAGIECHYYSSSSMSHAWNKVYFSDGSYLWVDVTWNDDTSSENFLLIDTKTLCRSHSL